MTGQRAGLAKWAALGGWVCRGNRTDGTERTDNESGATYARWLNHADPAVVANTMICLIHQANYLLDQQIGALERAFVAGGGYTEKLAVARIAERQKQAGGGVNRADKADRTDGVDAAIAVKGGKAAQGAKAPDCPQCGGLMALRTARVGQRAGSQFWGCAGFPECRGTVAV